MNNELATQDNTLSALQDVENLQRLCQTLMKTKHYEKMGQDGIFAIVAKAKSLNMEPLFALNGGLYFLQGKVGMATETMAMLVRKAGHSVTKDARSNNQLCILQGKRKDNGDTWSVSFSIDDAKRAGIYKEQGSWGKYPSAMCYNRAMSILFRQLFPDLSQGAGYTYDELEEIAAGIEVRTKGIEVPKVQDKISLDQAMDIATLFAKFPDYQNQCMGFLKKSYNVTEIEQIPLSLYERIINGAKTFEVKLAELYEGIINGAKTFEAKPAEVVQEVEVQEMPTLEVQEDLFYE